MKHAGPQALDALEPLLEKLRTILRTKPGLVERKRGIFYSGATAVLHFHEDPAGMFADLRSGADLKRYALNTKAEIAELLRAASATAEVRPRVKQQRNPRPLTSERLEAEKLYDINKLEEIHR